MKAISNETKCKLLNTLKDGKERTLEDIIRLLIEEHKRKWYRYFSHLLDVNKVYK